jgi:hypothetical protein
VQSPKHSDQTPEEEPCRLTDESTWTTRAAPPETQAEHSHDATGHDNESNKTEHRSASTKTKSYDKEGKTA